MSHGKDAVRPSTASTATVETVKSKRGGESQLWLEDGGKYMYKY